MGESLNSERVNRPNCFLSVLQHCELGLGSQGAQDPPRTTWRPSFVLCLFCTSADSPSQFINSNCAHIDKQLETILHHGSDYCLLLCTSYCGWGRVQLGRRESHVLRNTSRSTCADLIDEVRTPGPGLNYFQLP